MTKCKWTVQHASSGRQLHVCKRGRSRAVIVDGDGYYTYTLYHRGRFLKRGSAKTLRATKSAASRRMR